MWTVAYKQQRGGQIRGRAHSITALSPSFIPVSELNVTPVSDYEAVALDKVSSVPCLSVSDRRSSTRVLPAVSVEDGCVSLLFLTISHLYFIP